MSAPELKPCPFCWNEKIEDWGESTWSRPVKWMYCTECSAQGPRVMLERNEEYDAWLHRAITAWNTRADLAPAAPKVKALVWQDFDGQGAKASGFYQANYLITLWRGQGKFEVSMSYPGYQTGFDGERWHDTIEAAKSAAQADYEARILAALEGGDA